MSISVESRIQDCQQIQILRSLKANAVAAIQDFVTQGTLVYNNPDFAIDYPASWGAYQTYLLAAASAISNFESNFPAEPELMG